MCWHSSIYLEHRVNTLRTFFDTCSAAWQIINLRPYWTVVSNVQVLTVLPRTEDIPTRFAPAASNIPAEHSLRRLLPQTIGAAYYAAFVPTASSEPASQSIQMGSSVFLAIAGPAVDLTRMPACRSKDRLAKRRLHKGGKQYRLQLTSQVQLRTKQCVP